MATANTCLGLRVKNTFIDADCEEDELAMMKQKSIRRVSSWGAPLRRYSQKSNGGTREGSFFCSSDEEIPLPLMRRSRTLAPPRLSLICSDDELDLTDKRSYCTPKCNWGVVRSPVFAIKSRSPIVDTSASEVSDDSSLIMPAKGFGSPDEAIKSERRVRVQNTFLHLEEDDEEDEMAMLKAKSVRRVNSWSELDRSKQNSFVGEPAVDSTDVRRSLSFTAYPDTPLYTGSALFGDVEEDDKHLRRGSSFVTHPETPQHWAWSMSSPSTGGSPPKNFAVNVERNVRSPEDGDHAMEVRAQELRRMLLTETADQRSNCSGVSTQAPQDAPLLMSRKRGNDRVKGQLWCHIYISPDMARRGFGLNKRIIGAGGCRTRQIYEATGAKIRLRGRGSGHIETDGKEAPAPLMLAVTGVKGQSDKFCMAVRMSIELLAQIESEFWSWCDSQGPSARRPSAPETGHMFCIGNISPGAQKCAQDLISGYGLVCPGGVPQPQRLRVDDPAKVEFPTMAGAGLDQPMKIDAPVMISIAGAGAPSLTTPFQAQCAR